MVSCVITFALCTARAVFLSQSDSSPGRPGAVAARRRGPTVTRRAPCASASRSAGSAWERLVGGGVEQGLLLNSELGTYIASNASWNANNVNSGVHHLNLCHGGMLCATMTMMGKP